MEKQSFQQEELESFSEKEKEKEERNEGLELIFWMASFIFFGETFW